MIPAVSNIDYYDRHFFLFWNTANISTAMSGPEDIY